MRRRFGRRRWGGGGGRSGGGSNGEGRGLDVARELERVLQAGVVPTDALEPLGGDEIPEGLAAVGTGTAREGEPILVSVSPSSGADAWLGAVAAAARRVRDEGFRGVVYAVSPLWPLAARRRMALLRPGALRLRARLEPSPGAERDVAAETPEAALWTAAPFTDGLGRRAAAALAGLAAKHGGTVRPAAGMLEMVVLGRPVAALRAEDERLVLEALEPRRETLPLAAEGLSDAFDRLEGTLRKVLSDKRLREGELGARADLAARLAEAAEVATPLPWPLAGPLGEAADFAGVAADGRPVIGVARPQLGLLELGPVLDAWIALVPRLPALLGAAGQRPAGTPLLAIAAERMDPAVACVLGSLELEVRQWQSAGAGALVAQAAPARIAPGAGRSAAAPARGVQAETPPAAPRVRPEAEPRAVREGVESEAEPVRAADEAAQEPGEAEGPRRRYEEFSLFDLAESSSEDAGGAGGRRRRRRRRGRGRGRTSAEAGERGGTDEEREEDEGESEPVRALEGGGERRRRGGRGRRREPAPSPQPVASDEATEEGTDEEEIDEEAIVALAEVPVSEVEEPEGAQGGYDDEEEEEESPEDARLHAEREARRRARIAKTEPEATPPAPRAPRRRAAFLVHADRESIGAAVLLARETRLVEGIWIYPQADLMTFFRGVATDLREDTPIFVIGFVASPARDALQAAALYRDRLTWFDHHGWPPEDLEGLRTAIGSDAVHVDPGAGGVLPLVLAYCSRRSRFSDKLVDLLTGRFSRHDYERWGRVWWWRLGQLTARPGERRSDLDGLIAGRPSDLAREASRAAVPPPPPEVEWIAGRDFRLVHFGGYALVRVPVPPEDDVQLAARIARERYAAQLSLAWRQGEESFALGADEATSRRALDLGGMVEHLAQKFAYVKALPDADHVARFRIEQAAGRPDRIDEVVSEIAMGRSILEG